MGGGAIIIGGGIMGMPGVIIGYIVTLAGCVVYIYSTFCIWALFLFLHQHLHKMTRTMIIITEPIAPTMAPVGLTGLTQLYNLL